jgi:hypothetical protein
LTILEKKQKHYKLNKIMKNEEKQIVTKQEQNNQVNFYDEKRWNGWMTMAKTFVESGALPKDDNTAKVVMKIQAGYEMGMTPVRAIKAFYFVNGVMNIFGAEVTRRLTEHGWKIDYKEEPNKCTATIKNNEDTYSDTLTFDEAVKSHWTTTPSNSLKPGWYEGANRKQKLRYGALSMLIKSHVPEVLGSAVDIVEIAEDTVPVIQGEVINENQLDGISVDKINDCNTLDELKKVCREITNEKGNDYKQEIVKLYGIRKEELTKETQ